MSNGMEWLVHVKLFVDTSSELSFVLSSVSFPATSICICVSATHMLVHFFLNVCFNVFCMTLMTIVKISIKKDVQRSKLHIAMRVLSGVICCLRAAFWNFTEVSASLYSVKYMLHYQMFFWLSTPTEKIVWTPHCAKKVWDWSVHVVLNNNCKYCHR